MSHDPSQDLAPAVFSSLCTLHANLLADGERPFARDIEARAVAYARARAGSLRGSTAAAASSASRAIFTAIPFDQETISRTKFAPIFTWATAADWPMLLDHLWPLGTGVAWLAENLALSQDQADGFLQALERRACLIDPDVTHTIADGQVLRNTHCRNEIRIRAEILRLMVKKHPHEASIELEQLYLCNSYDLATLLLLAGAKNLPQKDRDPKVHTRLGSSRHDMMALVGSHGDLESFLSKRAN